MSELRTQPVRSLRAAPRIVPAARVASALELLNEADLTREVTRWLADWRVTQPGLYLAALVLRSLGADATFDRQIVRVPLLWWYAVRTDPHFQTFTVADELAAGYIARRRIELLRFVNARSEDRRQELVQDWATSFRQQPLLRSMFQVLSPGFFETYDDVDIGAAALLGGMLDSIDHALNHNLHKNVP